jgi:hypothetical protein
MATCLVRWFRRFALFLLLSPPSPSADESKDTNDENEPRTTDETLDAKPPMLGLFLPTPAP